MNSDKKEHYTETKVVGPLRTVNKVMFSYCFYETMWKTTLFAVYKDNPEDVITDPANTVNYIHLYYNSYGSFFDFQWKNGESMTQ